MKRVTRIFIPVLLALAMLVTPLFSNAAVLGGTSVVYAEEISDTADIVGEDEATNPDLVSDDVNGNSDIIDGTDAYVTDGTEVDVSDETDMDVSEEEIKASEDDNESETDVNSETDTDSDAAEAENSETLEEDPYTLYDNDEYDEEELAALTADDANGPDPQKIVEVSKTILAAVKGLGVTDDKANAFVKVMTKVGGGASAANGVIGVLSLFGLIGDSNSQALSDIITTLKDQNTALNEMNDKMDKIQQQITDIQADQILSMRKDIAVSHTKRWQNYNYWYLEKMKIYLNNYESWVNLEIKNLAWDVDVKTCKAIYAYYKVENNVKEQTYSKKRNINLTVSDSGDAIAQEYTIGLPAGYVADAMKLYRNEKKEWNIDKFREDITPYIRDAVIKAMNEKKLGCSQKFEADWNAASDEGKKTIAYNVATDLLNTFVYVCAREGVNNHSDEASALVTQMNITWDNTNKKEMGIANQIIPIYNTYSFQKEAKSKIDAAYCSLIGLTELYSLLAMTVAGQSDVIIQEEKNYARDQWLNGTDSLRKSWEASTISGADNYCYITGTKLTYDSYRIESKASLTTSDSRHTYYTKSYGWDSEKWKVYYGNNVVTSYPSILDSVGMSALYKNWKNTGKTTANKFSEFLNKCNTGVSEDNSGSIVTHYKGAKDFALSKPITMDCFKAWEKIRREYEECIPTHFKDGTVVAVMENTDRYKDTVLHDKVEGDVFNVKDEASYTNKVLASRAIYNCASGTRLCDEPWYFSDTICNTTKSKSPENPEVFQECKFTFETSKTIYVLKSESVSKNDMAGTLAEDEEIIFEEDEFDPREFMTGYAEATEIMDVSYKANTDADILSPDEWENINLDYLCMPETEEEMAEYISVTIDNRLAEEIEKGNAIKLSDAEKTELINTAKEILKNAEKEMSGNENMDTDASLDPFGIYGNDAVTEKLAKEVLPDSQIADDGQTMQPVKNMMTAIIYEPYVYFECEKSGDDYVLMPKLAYAVQPKLLVWNDDIEEVDIYDISDEVIKELGLSVTVRLNASDAGDNDIANIVHYDDVYEMNVLESVTAKIQGSGDNRYAEITVSSCSPFSVSYSKSGAVNTGDSNNMTIYYILIAIAGLAIVTAAAVAYRRRRLMK